MLDHQASSNNNTARTASTSSFQNGLSSSKRKRRPAGTPDPDAEVVALSPKTLLESDRYVCEICNQGFQRDQNLQMHRRRHKVPWKLVRRDDNGSGNDGGGNQEARKRVYVCPEPSCLHHDASHALGDLVGIKKHFRRKHSNYKQWVCDKCCKGYAVQSDYKAHLKTCGTRGHSCDCGRVFSRVESFIEHQDACTIKRVDPPQHQRLPTAFQPACSSSTSPSGCGETASLAMSHFQRVMKQIPKVIQHQEPLSQHSNHPQQHNLHELQLLPSSSNTTTALYDDKNETALLKLSMGISRGGQPRGEEEATIMRVAVAEKEYAEEVRRRSKRELELAELEFENAKRMRQQALGELERAKALRDQAVKKISSTMMQITCQACQQQFQASANAAATPPLLPIMSEESSHAVSFISSAVSEGDGGDGGGGGHR
uniref:C2H2-type domain-containing protein n=1 Tax=Kalanchoe fedtschenkoi TaxID=63787 RepID=A0A7N0TFT0_KALFE